MSTAEPARRRLTWLVWAGALLVRVLGWTWRIRVRHDEDVRRLRAAGQPIIFSLWHGHLLPLLYHHRGEGVAVLISEHADGEIIARVAARLGYHTVRGSTSRGSARALMGLVRAARDGHDLAITPDGPRGPARSIAPGTAVVAQRTGAPVIAVIAAVGSGWHLGSWDSFVIPHPFARVDIVYSDAMRIPSANARDAAANPGWLAGVMASAEARASG